MTELKRTPLFAAYQKHKPRLIDFGGWELPVQFGGINEEHLAVRSKAGIFDVSHMGELRVSGPQALAFLQKATVNDPSRLVVGMSQYSAHPQRARRDHRRYLRLPARARGVLPLRQRRQRRARLRVARRPEGPGLHGLKRELGLGPDRHPGPAGLRDLFDRLRPRRRRGPPLSDPDRPGGRG